MSNELIENGNVNTLNKSNKVWDVMGDDLFLRDDSRRDRHLPSVIYRVNATPLGELYLSKMQDKFDFGYKIYGVERKFIERVKKTFEETHHNMGILMNGVKGTGKTVTAKLLCNEMDMPTILVTNDFGPALPAFINDIHHDIILFFDEYEKIFEREDHTILTVMDGVLSNKYRRIFLLTTNDLYVNTNMLQRPGRVRYLKTFRDMEVDAITEIVDDKLQYPELKQPIIDFVSRLEVITIDIIKAIVDEVNIHQEGPEEFKNVFNVSVKHDVFNVFKKNEKGEWEEAYKRVDVNPRKINKASANKNNLQVDGDYLGLIRDVDENSGIITVDSEEYDEKDMPILVYYKVEKTWAYHQSFDAYGY